jgi:CzcA family heavy metal efflux pump
MEWLISLSVQRRGAAATLSLLALLLAIWGAWHTPLDVLPEFVPSRVTIETEAPGFTPEQVEQLVTHTIEKTLTGSEGVANIRSESVPGLSIITINFAADANLYNARQAITERLTEIGSNLPSGTGPPQLSPLTSSTRDLLKIGLISDRINAFALRETADYLIKPRLLALPGVARVSVFGGRVRQIQIQADPKKLAAYGFTVPDLVRAAPSALALRGAGFIDLKGQRVLIQTPTPSPDVSVIGDGILAVRGKTPVRLRDVATISEQPAQRFGDALIQGRTGVLLSVSSLYGANTLTTTREVEGTLARLIPSLKAQGIAIYPALHQPASFIERAIGNLGRSLAIGAVLILVVLYAFLRDWRSALISFISIPLSLLAAIAVLDHFNYTLNTMTLSGFVVALGVLVDDAVVSIENILRRLRDNSQHMSPRPRTEVIRDASLEVHGPIFYATLVVLAVFVPELLSSSVQGRLVGPLALAFMLAVVASLVVALTTTPALSALLLSPRDAHVDPWWISELKNIQARAIIIVERHLHAALIFVAALFVGALALLPFLGSTFVPEFREGHLVVQATSNIPGTSLDEMLALGRRISRDVMALPYVATVEQQVGRARETEDTSGPHQCEFHIELKPNVYVDQGRAEAELRSILARYPGIQSEVVTFLGDRISESLTGETAQVVVKLFGRDFKQLDDTGVSVTKVLAGIPGIVDLQFKRQSGTPIMSVELNPAGLAAVGIRGQDVLDTIATDYAGTTVGEAYSGFQTVDVVIVLPDRLRHSPELLGDLLIGGPFGPVPLANIAKISPSGGRYSIKHETGSRYEPVTFNVTGRSLQSVVAEAQDRISRANIVPAEVEVRFTGAAAAEQATRIELAVYSLFMLIFIVLVLSVGFAWRAHPWLVLTNLPFSLIGGIAAIAITGIGLSLGALVGLVTVFGISARNAILLLAYYEQLVDVDHQPWTAATVHRGANERLTPIFMTAILTALGLLPLALSINLPGQEISGPLAITVLGGLASSTIFNLILLPALAARYSQRDVNALASV